MSISWLSSEDGVRFRLGTVGELEGDYVSSDRPDAVLVAARQHEIDVIFDEVFEQQEFSGINYMKVELDFVVG